MSTMYFILAATAGFALTAGALTYFLKRGNLTHNQYALVLSIGFFITWLASFFAPFLASDSRNPEKGLIIFGVGFSIFTGALTYIIVRIILAIRGPK